MRNVPLLLLIVILGSLGCSGSNSEDKPGELPKAVADDLAKRGISTAAPPGPGPEPASAEFKPFDSPDGLIRVKFPGEPETKKLEAVPDMAKSGSELYRLTRGPRTYTVLCAHFTAKRDPANELQSLVDSNVRAVIDGKLVDSKDVTLKGRPGKDVTIAIDDETMRRARFFVGDMDIYQIVCDVPKTDTESAKVFVESFELRKE
jgi:hypothetical protein